VLANEVHNFDAVCIPIFPQEAFASIYRDFGDTAHIAGPSSLPACPQTDEYDAFRLKKVQPRLKMRASTCVRDAVIRRRHLLFWVLGLLGTAADEIDVGNILQSQAALLQRKVQPPDWPCRYIFTQNSI